MPKIDPRYYENIEETDKLANKIVNIFKKRSICTTKPAIKSKTIVKPKSKAVVKPKAKAVVKPKSKAVVKPKSKAVVKPRPDIVKPRPDIKFNDEEINDGTTREQRINKWIDYINKKY